MWTKSFFVPLISKKQLKLVLKNNEIKWYSDLKVFCRYVIIKILSKYIANWFRWKYYLKRRLLGWVNLMII